MAAYDEGEGGERHQFLLRHSLIGSILNGRHAPRPGREPAAPQPETIQEIPMASQRSDAISFIGLILAYGWFAVGVLADGLGQPDLFGRVLAFYIGAAVALALLQVAAEWAFGARPEADREFEREIGRRSGRNAYIAVLGVLWAVPFLLALPHGLELTLAASVGAMGLAEVVRYGSRLVYRGLGPTRLGTGRNQRAVAG